MMRSNARLRNAAFAPRWTSSPMNRRVSTGEFTDEIAKLVYGTHHIGASTDQAQEAIAAETVRIVRTFQGNRQGSERGESRQEDAGDMRADRASSRPAGRAGRACST